VPYHIGNGWGGGLVPFITTAAYTATGSLGYALIYPIAVPAICFVLSLFLMPETRERSIWEEAAAQKAQAASPRHKSTLQSMCGAMRPRISDARLWGPG
jgi:hypothetical protein